MKLILASTSKYRKKQLQSLGLIFEAQQPLFDEERHKEQVASTLSAENLSLELATLKAHSLLKSYPNSAIIGADQICLLKGEILHKGITLESTLNNLLKLNGKTHQLITSISLITSNQTLQYTDTTHIKMRKLTEKQLSDYIIYDQTFNCAGGYKYESAGLRLIKSIDTKDPSAIIGLPLLKLIEWLYQINPEITFDR